jgi:hypothetical protein
MVIASDHTIASRDHQMFATAVLADPWRVSVPATMPEVRGPRVTRTDAIVFGAIALVLLAIAAPNAAAAVIIAGLLGAAFWQGIQSVGPLTKPLVDGEPFVAPLAHGARGIAI